ncbi:hypothetical protein XELAEV_18031860mg [Xenopus laevis]|uniref:Uncharacterized protein n=1 Tax=Xenopus laevis TaxID=8355 RepID=A0A974CNM1_XENLA|nr:hypothetical protein XELAEV_18031860mg [Xenopus laevis]
MNSNFSIIWIILFGLYHLFYPSTSAFEIKGLAESKVNEETLHEPRIQWKRSVNETEDDLYRTFITLIPIVTTLSMLTFSVLIYVKIKQRKKVVHDVENPPEAAQPEETSPERPNSFRRLCKKMKQKITKHKPDIDIENPPETVPLQQTTSAKSRVSSALKKCKRKKQKKEVADAKEPPMTAELKYKAKAAEDVIRYKIKETIDNIETPSEAAQPEENTKTAKRVLRSMRIKKIKNIEEGEGSLKKLKGIKSKSSTAQNLNVVIEIPEDSEIVIETPKYSETVIEIPEDSETVIEIPEVSETVIEIPEDSETVIEIPEDSETEKQISEEKTIQPTGNICGDEEDELLLQMELLLLSMKCLHQSAEPNSEKQLVHVERSEDTCGDEELLFEAEFFLLLILMLIYNSAKTEREVELVTEYADKKDEPSLQEKEKTPQQVCKLYRSKKIIATAKACKMYEPGKRSLRKAKVCKLYGPGKTIQRKGRGLKFHKPEKKDTE